MRILAIDTDTAALDFLMRCKAWGHDCLWFERREKSGEFSKAGEGIVRKLTDYDALWSKYLDWADLVYVPMNDCYLDRLEPYTQLGYPIYSCNVAGARWEHDRVEGQRILKECGLSIIKGKEFHDYESAIAYVRSTGKAFVSKPNGTVPDKSLSYVAQSAADLVFMLGRWKENEAYVAHAKEHGFILQEKIIGCEMGVAGWFGPVGWTKMWEENFEVKKVMAGDLGQNCGEQGTVLRFVKESKLAEIVLKPLTKKLKEISYVGNIDVNCIIDENGVPWPLEFTARDGFPARHNQYALHEGDPANWMLDLINGKDTRQVRFNEVSISVVVSLPPKDPIGRPIYMDGANRNNVHLSQVMLEHNVPVDVQGKVVQMPAYTAAGDYVLVVTGTGETITGARRSAYTTLSKIKIPGDPSWRIDIGRGKLVENLPKIQKHGYATHLSF